MPEYSPCFRKSKGFRFQNFHTAICFQTPEYFPFFKKNSKGCRAQKGQTVTYHQIQEYSPLFIKQQGTQSPEKGQTVTCYQSSENSSFFRKQQGDPEFRKARQLHLIRVRNIIVSLENSKRFSVPNGLTVTCDQSAENLL